MWELQFNDGWERLSKEVFLGRNSACWIAITCRGDSDRTKNNCFFLQWESNRCRGYTTATSKWPTRSIRKSPRNRSWSLWPCPTVCVYVCTRRLSDSACVRAVTWSLTEWSVKKCRLWERALDTMQNRANWNCVRSAMRCVFLHYTRAHLITRNVQRLVIWISKYVTLFSAFCSIRSLRDQWTLRSVVLL